MVQISSPQVVVDELHDGHDHEHGMYDRRDDDAEDGQQSIQPKSSGCCDGRTGDKPVDASCCVPDADIVRAAPSCQSSCCGNSDEKAADEPCSVSEPPRQEHGGCHDGCCSGPSNAVAGSKLPKQTEKPVKCCPTPEPRSSISSDQDSRCEKRDRSCKGCDTECLDRVALRACEQEKETIKFDDMSSM